MTLFQILLGAEDGVGDGKGDDGVADGVDADDVGSGEDGGDGGGKGCGVSRFNIH